MLGSRRALRMQRRHERARRIAGLSMVSLMDIFTILVFFLLAHAGDGEVLPTAKAVRLPESIADQAPKPTLVVTVNEQDILVQGRKVASVRDAAGADSDVIAPLKAELDYQARRDSSTKKARDITIMGDREIPYELLRRIMLTCVRANYENISLAVLRKEQQI